MCGILIHPLYLEDDSRFKFDVGKSRGIERKSRAINGFKFAFDHLPIQTTIDDDPFIMIDGWLILFNGEIFEYEGHESDVDFIKSIIKDATKKTNQREFVARTLFDTLLKLDGFFAITMFDMKSEDFYYFVDPMGKKPLYINLYNKIISSTLGACFDRKDVFPNNMKVLDELFTNGYIVDSSTVISKVVRALPGRLYRVNFSENYDHFVPIVLKNYNYFVAYHNLWKGEDLGDLLQEAVDNRIKNLKEITLFYSGGLDSSIIDYHIKNSKFKPEVKKLSLDIEDCEFENKVIQSDGVSSKSEALKCMELPYDLGSLGYQYDLFKNTETTVVLTGDGADELFGGYKRTFRSDTQSSDIEELIYFHNVKIDKMSSAFTKECRCPFQAPKIISYALRLPYEKRIGKNALFDYGLSIGIKVKPKRPMKVKKVDHIETYDLWIESFLKGVE